MVRGAQVGHLHSPNHTADMFNVEHKAFRWSQVWRLALAGVEVHKQKKHLTLTSRASGLGGCTAVRPGAVACTASSEGGVLLLG